MKYVCDPGTTDDNTFHGFTLHSNNGNDLPWKQGILFKIELSVQFLSYLKKLSD